MLLAKWVILVGIFATSLTIGFSLGDRYAKRVYFLREMLQSIKILKTEIIIHSNPLPIALENTSNKTDKKINQIYQLILEDIVSKEGVEIYLSFLKAKDSLKNECFLTNEDIDLFLNLGKVIGKTERLDQDIHFTHTIEELKGAINEAKIERDKNQKMYRSLGLLLGLGAIIILI